MIQGLDQQDNSGSKVQSFKIHLYILYAQAFFSKIVVQFLFFCDFKLFEKVIKISDGIFILRPMIQTNNPNLLKYKLRLNENNFFFLCLFQDVLRDFAVPL